VVACSNWVYADWIVEAAVRSTLVASILTLPLLGIAPPVVAQEGEIWYRVQIVQVRPEKLDDFTELYRDEVNPALQKAGVPWRSAWRTGQFGETYERQFITPIAGFSELDGGGPLSRALGRRAYDRVLDKLRESSSGRQAYAVRYRQDLSVESADVSGLSIARVTNVRVAAGREGDFEAFLRANLDTFRDAGVVFGVYQRQFGPGPVVWQIVENLRNYGELARGGIFRAFGDQSAREATRLTGVITSIERTVLEYDAELSFTGTLGVFQ